MTGSHAPGRPGTDRAVTPMVAKTLEAGIVVLFITVVTTGLYAGVVPDYRTATAADVGERTLVAAGNEIERSVPPDAAAVHAETHVDLPATIRSEEYRIVAGTRDAEGSETTGVPTVELDHDHPAVGGSYALAVPDHVVDVRGELTGGDGRIVVRSVEDGVVVVLEDGT